MEPDKPARIDADFRNGSLAAVSVIVGFSLSFLSRWAGLPGQWHKIDLLAVCTIVLGIACQIKALSELLKVSSLDLANYNRSIAKFMVGVGLVAVGIASALIGDVTGIGQRILGD